MRRFLALPVALGFSGALLASPASASARRPTWILARGRWRRGSQRWQKAETDITTKTVAENFKFLWKLKLGNGARETSSFSEPLLFPGLITGRGFKDLAFLADTTPYMPSIPSWETGLAKGFPVHRRKQALREYSGDYGTAAGHSLRCAPARHSKARLYGLLLTNQSLLPRVAWAVRPEADILA